jgi:3-isopropylmalate/(R)-2-methylmalate dehydratase small subunit
MENTFKGKTIWAFPDNFNADLIVGSKYIGENDREVLGRVCLTDFDPDFRQKTNPGDLMIAGRNFGYGHPHYQGIISLQQNQISTVIAESFYPLWYRIAVFYAFPVIVCPMITRHAVIGDEIEVNLETGSINNLTTGKNLKGEAVHPFLLEIMKNGGMPKHLSQILSKSK